MVHAWHEDKYKTRITKVGNEKGNIFCYINREGCHAAAAAAKSLQSCPTLCDPIDGSPSGSTVPGILQARTLEWVGLSYTPFIFLKTLSLGAA